MQPFAFPNAGINAIDAATPSALDILCIVVLI
jgi:hypothetical protein